MDRPNASQSFWHSGFPDHEDFEMGQSHSSIDVLPGQDLSRNTAKKHQGSANQELLNALTARTTPPPPKPKSKAKELPPLKPKDPNDSEEMKRVRNTCAARASRRRKREEEANLRQRVDDLEVEVDYWRELAKEKGWADYDGTARYLNRVSRSNDKAWDIPAGELRFVKPDRGSCH